MHRKHSDLGGLNEVAAMKALLKLFKQQKSDIVAVSGVFLVLIFVFCNPKCKLMFSSVSLMEMYNYRTSTSIIF
jgi:hypothetical protein